MLFVTVISAAGLTMQFGSQRALDSLDLEVPKGVTGWSVPTAPAKPP